MIRCRCDDKAPRAISQRIPTTPLSLGGVGTNKTMARKTGTMTVTTPTRKTGSNYLRLVTLYSGVPPSPSSAAALLLTRPARRPFYPSDLLVPSLVPPHVFLQRAHELLRRHTPKYTMLAPHNRFFSMLFSRVVQRPALICPDCFLGCFTSAQHAVLHTQPAR